MILNIVGGLLSFVQSKLDLSSGEDASTNPPKLVLGISVAVFKLIMFLQHAYFLTNRKDYE